MSRKQTLDIDRTSLSGILETYKHLECKSDMIYDQFELKSVKEV